MVYAANGGLLVNGKAVVARFAYPQRAGESAAYAEWMARHGFDPAETRHVNEGQGDLLVVGSIVLAGYGFRTERQAHAEIAALVGMPVVSLELVDPRFYHLDTALAVLDDTTIAYYPPAFSAAARARLQELFPDAIEVATADAYVLGLNAVSDGLHVVLPAAATRFVKQLADASAVKFGHRTPEVTATAHAQLDAVTLVSRAFHSDRLGPFCAALAELCGKDMVLPMNSGAEAVESGIKVARKWGTDVKGVPAGQSNIIVAHNNFHGRTTTIISFSDDETARRGFGPYTPGFLAVPFRPDDPQADAMAAAVADDTAAVLIEPIQGAAGLILPPAA